MRKRAEQAAERVSARLLRRSVVWANVKAYHQPRVRVGPVVAQPRIVVVARGHLPVYATIRKCLERSFGEPKGLLAEVAAVRGDQTDELVQTMEGTAERWGTPDRFDPSLFLHELVRGHDGPTTTAAFEATIDHVRPGGLYVVDDITQEPEQELAWVRIRNDPRVHGSLEINARHGVCIRA